MIQEIKKIWNGYGGWLFLALCLLVFFVTLGVDYNYGVLSFKMFLQIAWNVLPVIIIVFILIFFFNIFLDHKKIVKFLGSRSGVKGWAFAIIAGILSSGPIYMWYPLLEDLRKKGMRDSLAVTFLYNRGVKPPLLPMMVFYFGSWFTVLLTFYMVVFSIVNGFIIEKILNRINK